MDFQFSEDQEIFRRSVAAALAGAGGMQECRRILDNGLDYSLPAWRALCELGAPAIAIPEKYGGLGLDALYLCVVAEEVGRCVAPVPSLSSIYLCTEALRLFGSSEQKRTWLPLLACGDLIGAWAVDIAEVPERGAPELRVNKLYGKVGPVLDGAVAGISVLSVQSETGSVPVVVDLSGSGVNRRRLTCVDPSRPVAEIEFHGAPCERLDTTCASLRVVEQRAAVLLAFEQLGGATSCLEMGRNYALARRAFGRQIGSFQAIKHRLADIYVKIELARAHALFGGWACSGDSSQLRLAAAGARCAATDAFAFAAQENLQVHGAMGFAWDVDCHLFYRRARLWSSLLGPPHLWKDDLAGALIDGAPPR